MITAFYRLAAGMCLPFWGAIALGLAGLVAVPAPAAARGEGQYSRMYHSKNGYMYRKYTYYSPRHRAPKSHYVIYHSKYPRYAYYFNPETKKYWGRCDLYTGGYSKLRKEDRRGSIGDIDEGAFPQPGKMPPPEEGMDDPMLPPPEVDGGNPPLTDDTKILPYPTPADSGCHSYR